MGVKGTLKALTTCFLCAFGAVFFKFGTLFCGQELPPAIEVFLVAIPAVVYAGHRHLENQKIVKQILANAEKSADFFF